MNILSYIREKLDFKKLSFANILESRILLYSVALIVLLKVVSVALYFPFSNSLFFADITRIDLVYLMNKDRQMQGLKPLAENERLNQVALLKAKDMIANEYFSHNSPTGVTPWYWFAKEGYVYSYAGENLAVGYVDSNVVYDAWMGSESHRANLMNSHYTQVGTAIVPGFGQNNATLVVQEFGAPKAVQQKPTIITTPKTAVSTAPIIVEEPITQPQTSVTSEEKVLAQSTQDFEITNPTQAKNTTYLRAVNYVVYNSADLLQKIIYLLLLVVGGLLMGALVMSEELERRGLILKSAGLLLLLVASTLVTSQMISQVTTPGFLIKI